MHQLVVVSEPNAWPTRWSLQNFQVRHLEALAALSPDTHLDCLALVQPQSQAIDAVLHHLEERGRVGAVATLMVGRADSARDLASVLRHQFDGFLDLAWPAALAEASIRTALRHVELGRNMVDIQRIVIEQARQETASLYELANHDGLTNLFNHRYFAEMMNRQHEVSKRRGEAYALVFIDLDDLKVLNARFGHAGGSRALNELATIIAASTRATDVAVRMGGDEFAVFLAKCDQAHGTEFAARLCERLREHSFELDGQRLSITISCGVASYPEDGLVYSELLDHADRALFRAKALGKDRAVGCLPRDEPRISQ